METAIAKRKPVTDPVLRYFGAKWKISDWILKHLPPHRIYLEPFGGSAAILFRKAPAELEVYNDINGDIVNFFKVLRNRTDELIRALVLTPYSRDEFERCRYRSDDELESARRFYVQSAQGRAFGGKLEEKQNSWRIYAKIFDGASCHRLSENWVRPENLIAAAMRLRTVMVENQNALDIVSRYASKNSLIYADPPYHQSTRSAWKYNNDLSSEDQGKVAECLTSAPGMVVVSGYRCDDYDRWFSGWHRIDRQVLTTASNMGTNRAKAVESIWINPMAANQLPKLF